MINSVTGNSDIGRAHRPLRPVIALCGTLAVLGGCASAPRDSVPLINSYSADSTEYNSLVDRDNCEADFNLFNRRQLMVTSMAVQSAWYYCLRYSGGGFFPEEEDGTEGDWTEGLGEDQE